MKVVNEIAVAASPDAAWRVVGDLAAVDTWTPGVARATVIDGTRVCTLADGGEIHEMITSYSNESRSYAYEQTRHPLPLDRSRGSLRVEPEGSGSRIVWEAEVEVPDSNLEEMLRAGYAAAMAALADRLSRSAGSSGR